MMRPGDQLVLPSKVLRYHHVTMCDAAGYAVLPHEDEVYWEEVKTRLTAILTMWQRWSRPFLLSDRRH